MAQPTANARETAEKRYFLRDDNGQLKEDFPQLWSRIATCVSGVEKTEFLRSHYYREFYRLLDHLDFMPNSPTIMNAGVPKGQLSACFVLPISDEILNGHDGIYDTLGYTAKVHQSGGGTGFSIERLRPKNSPVDSKQGVASGGVSFMTVYDKSTQEMKQGGKRKGANMCMQRIDHPDILEFIDAKLTPGMLTNFNVSVAVTDAFMEALENDEEYELYHPATGVTGKLKARYVWDRIATNAHKSAEPGIVFIDRVNARSPYKERIEATNPCGEQPLPPWGACNLGSINLANFVVNGVFDWGRLQEVTRTATRFLDNVIDANHWPHEELEKHAKYYRNIGLGIMGWADALILMGIPYNSKRALELAEEVQAFINAVSHQYSILLGEEKGLPEGAPFKTFYDYSSPYRRNATLTTVAPTGSICIFVDASSGLEANFEYEFEKWVMDTVLTVMHPLYKKAKEEGWYDPKVFVTSHDISPQYHVLMQAAFQKHCDSGISKTANLPKDATVEDVQDIYQLAYQTECKGVTVYVDGSREGVLHAIEQKNEDACCEKPNIVAESGCETCMNCQTSKCLIS